MLAGLAVLAVAERGSPAACSRAAWRLRPSSRARGAHAVAWRALGASRPCSWWWPSCPGRLRRGWLLVRCARGRRAPISRCCSTSTSARVGRDHRARRAHGGVLAVVVAASSLARAAAAVAALPGPPRVLAPRRGRPARDRRCRREPGRDIRRSRIVDRVERRRCDAFRAPRHGRLRHRVSQARLGGGQPLRLLARSPAHASATQPLLGVGAGNYDVALLPRARDEGGHPPAAQPSSCRR